MTEIKGIIDIQLYFPSYYVDQSELETHDNAGQGKYTIGLGQEKMAFTSDREDINSISLTVLDKLLSRNKLIAEQIGRLEVGTETFVDKSKSIKTYLMDFFRGKNHDIEGVSTTNACYGGTNALFNAINWLYSDFYDGRYAIVICADIAVYAKGRARPTGGCGAVAILLGKGAHIEIEKHRSTYMNNVYDFYKPDPVSEYPIVDGAFSLDCYFKALESCYEVFLSKGGKSVENFDFFCFHSPFSKMVEKAFLNLLKIDIEKNVNSSLAKEFPQYSKIPSKNIIAELKKKYDKMIKSKVIPSLFLGKNLGNIYTGSLYIGLLSLIINNDLDLNDKSVLMFSYGSGCAASMYSVKINKGYLKIRENNKDVITNLNKRIKVKPVDYENMMMRKEKLYHSKDYLTEDKLENLFNGTYYLEKIDEKWRRYYSKKGENIRKIEFNKLKNKSLNRLNLIRDQLHSKNLTLPSKTIYYDDILLDRIRFDK